MEYYAAKINENGTIAVDDSILVKGAESTYGSKILMGFKPLFSAEAERLEERIPGIREMPCGRVRAGSGGRILPLCTGRYETGKPAAALVAKSDVKAALEWM
ncbi:hypothetical protein [Blautia sp.]|uniref:hypothetical protein n=1 Tax=Blautia sp. TaxID=1955243 RepID=UPI003995D20F